MPPAVELPVATYRKRRNETHNHACSHFAPARLPVLPERLGGRYNFEHTGGNSFHGKIAASMSTAPRRAPGPWLLLVFAAAGAALLYLPTVVMQQYQNALQLGPLWGRLYLAVVGIGGCMLAGSTGWLVWRLWKASRVKRKNREQRTRNPSQMSIGERENEIQSNLAAVTELQNDPSVTTELRQELTPLIRWIEEKQEQKRLEIVAFGTISSGKSSLLNALAGRDVFSTDIRGGTTIQRSEIAWPGLDEVRLVDTPGIGEAEGADHESLAAEAAKDADLVLTVVDGPLRDSEFQLLQRLSTMEKRVIVCLNKEDWFSPSDRDALLGQIRRQLQTMVGPEDIIAVRSRWTTRPRVRVRADGTEVQETVEVAPDIQPLADRMLETIRRDGRDLLAANLLLQSRGLVEDAKDRVKEALDRRAREIIDRYTWGAAGAAALSPLPMVDLAAGCAISTKMVLDLARVYHQTIDSDAAVNLLGQQGKTLLGVIGSTTATPLVTSSVASMIKAVPGVGTLAGGLLQGVVQALITRWIGGIFMVYFKNEMKEPPGGLAALARREWERVTSVSEMRKLIQSAREHFQSEKT